MKPNRSNRLFLRLSRGNGLGTVIAITLAGIAAHSQVQAASRYWDGGTTNVAGAGDGISTGGSGNWDTTIQNWDDGTSHVAWANASLDGAVFGALAGGTVALTTGISANSLTFNSAGYVVSGNTVALGGTTPTITTNADASVASTIAGSAGLVKAGNGILTLTGQSSFSGALNVNAGTVNMPTAYSGGSKTVSCATINLAPLTALTCNAGAFGWYANNNAAGLTINIDEGATCQANGAFGVAYTLKGGSIIGTNSQRLDLGKSSTFNASVTSFASATTSVINPTTQVYLRTDSGQTSYTFTVADGSALIDLDIQKPINTQGASTGIVKAGAGVMRLNSTANGYSGPTSINAGTLALGATGTILASTPVTVAPGALLDASAIAAGYTVATGKSLVAGRPANPATDILGNVVLNSGTGSIRPAGDGINGTMTIDGSLTLNGGTLAFDPTDLIALAGVGRTLTLAGTNTVTAAQGFLAAGTYTLVNGFASATGSATNFAYGSPTRGQLASFSVNAGDVKMILDSGAPAALTWTGAANGFWENSSVLNWNNGTAARFYSLDSVTFDDTLKANLTTNLTAATNNDLRYTAVTGGNDAVSIAYVNPATPSAVLAISVTGNAITVNLGTDAASVVTTTAATVKALIDSTPAAAALVTVANETGNTGTGLVAAMTTSYLSRANPISINGSLGFAALTLANNATALTLRGGTSPVLAGPGALTKTGSAQVTWWHPSDIFTGGATIGAGTLLFNSGAALASGSFTPLGTGTIALNGGVLQLNPGNNSGGNYAFPNAVTLNGGTIYQDDGVNTFSGPVTVAAASTIRGHYATKDLYLAGGLAGAAPLKISNTPGSYGPASVHLTADGSYSGTITIDNSSNMDGSLYARSNNALQSANLVLNTTNSIIVQNGTYTVGLTLAGAATNVTLAGLSGTNSAARVHNGDGSSRTLTINQSADSSFAGGIGDGTGNGNKIDLVKTGGATLTLAGQDSYTGSTTVAGGKLVMSTRNTGAANITVADAAALGVNSTGVALAMGNLTLGTAGTTTLAIGNFPANAAVPVIEAVDVVNNSTTTISVNGSLTTGSYPLLAYSSLSGPGSFVLAPLPRGVAGNLSNSGWSIDLNITGFNQLVWKGTAGSAWDVNNTLNWKLGTTNPDKYLDGDNVLFNGSAASTSVELNTSVAPASVNFAFDDPASYTVTGTGAIAGSTGIVKSGTGTLTLATANTYTGSTAVNSGVLVLGNPAALGSTISGTTVSSGAVLDLNGQSVGGESLMLAGTLRNSSGSAAAFAGSISLTGDSSIGGTGNLSLSSAITGASALAKTGSGSLTLTNSSSAFTGTVTVSEGVLVIGAWRSLENAPIIVGNGGTLRVTADNGFQFHAQPVTVKAGGILSLADAGTCNIGPGGSFTMEGGATLACANPNGNWGSWTINNNTGGATVITVAAGNPVAAEISAKLVTPSQPVLILNVADVTGSPAADLVVSGSLGSPATTGFAVTISGGGTTLINAANTYTGTTTVNAGSTLGGIGSFAGPLHVAGTIAPGTTGTGTLSGKSLVLTGSYACDVDVAACDSLAISGDIDVTGATLAVTALGAPGAASYVIASCTGTLTGTFASVTGMPAGYLVQYDSTAKQIKLAKPGFSAWADSWTGPALSDKSPGGDPDGDGISNLLEYVLGGDPRVSSTSILPSVSQVGTDLVLSYKRNDDSVSDTIQIGQWSSDMIGWTDVTPVVVNENGTAPDDMTVTVPTANAVDGKLFLRLKVSN